MATLDAERVLLATLSEVFAELASAGETPTCTIQERLGMGANLDVEAKVDGATSRASINIFPDLFDDSVVLQVDNQLFHLHDFRDQLARNVGTMLRSSECLRRILPNAARND